MAVATCLLLGLVGCASIFVASPSAVPTSSPLPPRPLPKVTLQIMNSEEIYRNHPQNFGRTDPRFASLPVDAVLPPLPIADSPRRVKVVLEGGKILQGERLGFGLPRRPGILVLAKQVADWSSLTKKLSESGFMVLALQTENWLEARQVETILESLSVIENVDAGRLAIVGAAENADLAMLGCAVNALCDAAALFSPLSRDTLLNMMPSYGGRPLWLAVGENDGESIAAAESIGASSRR